MHANASSAARATCHDRNRRYSVLFINNSYTSLSLCIFIYIYMYIERLDTCDKQSRPEILAKVVIAKGIKLRNDLYLPYGLTGTF